VAFLQGLYAIHNPQSGSEDAIQDLMGQKLRSIATESHPFSTFSKAWECYASPVSPKHWTSHQYS
jgi:hypothetical protein